MREPLDAITQIVEEVRHVARARPGDGADGARTARPNGTATRRPTTFPGSACRLTATGAQSPLLPRTRARHDRPHGARSRRVLDRHSGSGRRARPRSDLAGRGRALDELGIGVALRDFGSAVSSLDQLRTLADADDHDRRSARRSASPTCDDEASEAERGVARRDRAVRARRWAASSWRSASRICAHAERLRELGFDFGSGPAFGPTIPPDQVRDFLAAVA